jgi:hypothetical protein
MNNRIQELANKAGLWKVVHFPHLTDEESQSIEKFAQLIVQECADVLDKQIAPPSNPMNSLGYELKQHFKFQDEPA